MKLALITLLGLVAIAASQPVDEAAILSVVPVDDAVMEADDAAIDMMPDESALKVIMHKLDHWLKKCHKKGGCRDDYNYSYHGYSHHSYGGHSYSEHGYGGYDHGK